MDVIGIGAAGLQNASHRFEASAQRMASGEGDLATEIVAQAEAKTAFDASAVVIRAGEEMSRRLVDIKV